MSREAVKHIKTWHERCEEHPDHQERIISERMIQARMQEEIDELRQALEIEQEPVAWMYVNSDGECEQIEYGRPFDDPGVTPLYTAPPKREWVGLTEEEINNSYLFWVVDQQDVLGFGKSLETKLKRKNT